MKNELIFVQWTNNFGGLEKITQLYEEVFHNYNPLILILRYNENGLIYKNSFTFNKKWKYAFILQYLSYVRKRKKSIFHIQYSGSIILLLTYLAGARKIVYHFHGTKFQSKSIDKIIWNSLKQKVNIIANSSYTKEIINLKLKINNKVVIIPNLININEYIFTERIIKNNIFRIIYAGRFSKGKNIDLIIETAKELINKENVEFLLVGDGPEKPNIEKKIKDHSLSSVVRTSAFTHELKNLYYESNLFIFTSGYESFGNVVAEAILTGLPVLCLKISALTELIKDDIFFVDEPNPKIFADKIKFFKNNYDHVNHKLKNINVYLRDYLNNDEIIKKLNSIYQRFQ